jgi:hypothetical protein
MMDDFIKKIKRETKDIRKTREIIKDTAERANSDYAEVLESAQYRLGTSLPAKARMFGCAKSSMKTLEAMRTRSTARSVTREVVEEPEVQEEPQHVTFEDMDTIAERLKEALKRNV